MENLGHIEISITGSRGSIELTPDNYDIREIITILQTAESLLFPTGRKDRPTISYSIEPGSVKHIIKTSLQAVIGFNAVIGQMRSSESVDFLEAQSAQAIENLQENALKNNYELSIKTSVDQSNELKINSKTRYIRTQNIWVDAEFYFYGILTSAGGKNKANVHLDTEDLGSLTIQTDRAFLGEKEENLLYREFGVRAIGKQNVQTTEMDKSSLKLIELIDYSPKYDQNYLSSLMKKASAKWSDVNDADDWLNTIRGNYEA
ncbi:hypothetical protein [Marinoscillum furvescens]|uniref:Uncharacterized protein n=1 Tax=Marinoscillum furvescens DSM 4134 TaxID=1122208 RepID=A0A3D9KZ13_MARFU|nr:hypothetical protein [Marinoscillum furvescens]RED95289.1 hypothetical protein C7460_11866 [Marinoscillum furvescens DSM 4134]